MVLVYYDDSQYNYTYKYKYIYIYIYFLFEIFDVKI